MAGSDQQAADRPQQSDLDRCVHCGLCLNACPTYRELRVEMDSPRGRIYQMVQVASGAAELNESYVEHLDLCLACRACETACPSGVPYGRLIEAARADIENRTERPWLTRVLRDLVFRKLLPSRTNLQLAGRILQLNQALGLTKLLRRFAAFRRSRPGEIESLSPPIETPFFFRQYGQTLPAEGAERHRVAFLGGCIANLSFARLNEATVRVLRRNGCTVDIPAGQTCCGALHVHAGIRDQARTLARRNIDALLRGNYDAIITNAAGCGSTLKEYGELLEHDREYVDRAARFSGLVKDVNEFLAGIELNREMGAMPGVVTYQDSCHLAHGQRIRTAPRQAAGCNTGAGVSRDAAGRPMLRQRGDLQHRAHGHGAGAAREKDADHQRDRRADHRDGKSRVHIAASRRRAAVGHRAAGNACSRVAGRGILKKSPATVAP